MVFRFKLGVRALIIERRGPACRYRDYCGVPEGLINVQIGRVRVPEKEKMENRRSPSVSADFRQPVAIAGEDGQVQMDNIGTHRAIVEKVGLKGWNASLLTRISIGLRLDGDEARRNGYQLAYIGKWAGQGKKDGMGTHMKTMGSRASFCSRSRQSSRGNVVRWLQDTQLEKASNRMSTQCAKLDQNDLMRTEGVAWLMGRSSGKLPEDNVEREYSARQAQRFHIEPVGSADAGRARKLVQRERCLRHGRCCTVKEFLSGHGMTSGGDVSAGNNTPKVRIQSDPPKSQGALARRAKCGIALIRRRGDASLIGGVGVSGRRAHQGDFVEVVTGCAGRSTSDVKDASPGRVGHGEAGRDVTDVQGSAKKSSGR
ncbi:hypothetical protein B0H14DRAFT_2605531 [Mycena olivaceomarginata]|nr:hypothetical protein B0H14DRAFT_2605531 [Mycena olivaceomarginata]